jgi:hypothetical protein
MNGTAPANIGMLVASARDGLDAGKEVSINAVGTRGWVAISALDFAGNGGELLCFTGRYGENEGALFYIPSEALLSVRIADAKFT